MNEYEAKRKWCPFTRTGVLAGTGAVAVNRHVTDDDRNEEGRLVESETRCIASACMAWRWSTLPDQATPAHTKLGINGEGYCGLAGKP